MVWMQNHVGPMRLFGCSATSAHIHAAARSLLRRPLTKFLHALALLLGFGQAERPEERSAISAAQTHALNPNMLSIFTLGAPVEVETPTCSGVTFKSDCGFVGIDQPGCEAKGW